MEDIDMKTEFIAFLKREGIYDNFIANVMKQKGKTLDEILSDTHSTGNPIDRGFTWSTTPEGDTYWNKYYRMWGKIKNSIQRGTHIPLQTNLIIIYNEKIQHKILI